MSTQSHVSVKDFGARGDGVYLTGLKTNTNDSKITLSGLSNSDIGKLMYIDAAGTNYETLVTNITNVSGSEVTLADPTWPAISERRGFYGTDDYAAITAAISDITKSHGGVVFFPKGIYALSQPLEITSSSVRLAGVGSGSGNAESLTIMPVSELRFTGSGDGVHFNGGPTPGYTGGPNALAGCGISDLSICGTSHLSNCLRIRNTHHSHFARIRVTDCTAAGLKIEFANSNVYDHFRFSNNETPALTNALPLYGIHLTRPSDSVAGTPGFTLEPTASHFIVPVVEGAINGYFEECGSSNIVTSGAFGGCQSTGMILGTYASNGVYSAIDIEGNLECDIEVQSHSFGHLFEGILAISGAHSHEIPHVGGITFHANSYHCTVIGGEYQNIRILSGPPAAAQLITLVGVQYLHRFLDDGINTRNLGTWFGPSGLWDITRIPAGISIGNGSGVIKNHYQKIGVKVVAQLINPNSGIKVVVPLTNSGIQTGDLLIATPRGNLGKGVSYYAYISGDDEVTIMFSNISKLKTHFNTTLWDFMSWRL